MNDNEIIQLYFDRNESAIEKTSGKFGKLLQKIAQNILGNYHDAQECVSDAYRKAWETIPPENPSSLSAYLSKITRNKAVDMMRKSSAEKRGSGEMMLVLDEISECVSGKDSVEKEVAAIQLQNDINLFLRILDEEKRNIFICRYWYAYSVKEIAKGFCKKESTVAVMLCRTREKLKVFLEERGYEI